MIRRDAFFFGFNAALGAALLALLLFLGYSLLGAATAIAGPFLGAVVVSLMLDPLVTLLQARVTRGKRGGAVLIVFLLFLLLLVSLFTFVVPNLVEQTQRLVRWFSPVTYTVRRTSVAPGGEEPRELTVAEGIADTTLTVKRLVNGVTYRFVVLATNAEGGVVRSEPVLATPSEDLPDRPAAVPSPAGAPQSAEPAPSGAGPSPTSEGSPGPAPTEAQSLEDARPGEPRDPVATAGDGEVRLAWKAPVGPRSGFDQLRSQVDAWLIGHRQIGPIKLPENLESITSQYSEQIAQLLRNSAGRAGDIVLGSVARLFDVILVPIIAAYILADLDRLRARFFFLMPEKARGHALATARDIGGVFGNYVRGLVTICSLYGATAMAILFALSFVFPPIRSYALLLGFAAGLLYAVPYVGALSIVLLAVVGAVSTGAGTAAAVWSVLLLIALNQIFDNVLMPRIVGGEVGLHPLLSLFALILGGKVFGLWGMLLAVPVAASIQAVLFRLYPRLKAPTPLSLLIDAGGREARRQATREARERQAEAELQAAAEADPAVEPLNPARPADAPPEGPVNDPEAGQRPRAGGDGGA